MKTSAAQVTQTAGRPRKTSGNPVWHRPEKVLVQRAVRCSGALQMPGSARRGVIVSRVVRPRKCDSARSEDLPLPVAKGPVNPLPHVLAVVVAGPNCMPVASAAHEQFVEACGCENVPVLRGGRPGSILEAMRHHLGEVPGARPLLPVIPDEPRSRLATGIGSGLMGLPQRHLHRRAPIGLRHVRGKLLRASADEDRREGEEGQSECRLLHGAAHITANFSVCRNNYAGQKVRVAGRGKLELTSLCFPGP